MHGDRYIICSNLMQGCQVNRNVIAIVTNGNFHQHRIINPIENQVEEWPIGGFEAIKWMC